MCFLIRQLDIEILIGRILLDSNRGSHEPDRNMDNQLEETNRAEFAEVCPSGPNIRQILRRSGDIVRAGCCNQQPSDKDQ